MTDNNTNDAQGYEQPTGPNADLKSLTGWSNVDPREKCGDLDLRVDGRRVLIQRVNLEQYGQKVRGIEVIGHLRPFGEEPSEDIKSRFYDSTGNTLDYVYELEGDTLTIWGGEKGSPAYSRGTFSDDGKMCSGEWVYPGGGYEWTMTRTS